MLSSFLAEYVEEIPDYTNVPIEDSGILTEFNKYPLGLTHFEDLYDTIFYSNLIAKAIDLARDPRLIIDCGAGSSIPTLLALKKASRSDIRIIAVDIDPEAKVVGRRNAEALGLADRYTFFEKPMEEILESEVVRGQRTLLVSNPPYIPAPDSVTDHSMVPVNGGEDGSRYLLDILSQYYPAGTTLALLWGSLTSPLEVLPLMRERFEVLHVDAVRIHFGKYTKDPVIHDHLLRLRREGKVVFDGDREAGESQLVLGTIIRAKDRRS